MMKEFEECKVVHPIFLLNPDKHENSMVPDFSVVYPLNMPQSVP
jgi:hypothetical protein